MANNYDWIGLMERTKKAHTPTFGQTTLQPFGQAFSQGLVGKHIAQDELRKAIFTALLGTHQPMVGEEPATMNQMMGAMRGKPGVIPSLFGAKEPPELTWKPIKEEKAFNIKQWAVGQRKLPLEQREVSMTDIKLDEIIGIEPKKGLTSSQEEELKIKRERLKLEKEKAEREKGQAKVDYAFDFVRTFAPYDDEDLKEKGLLVEMNNQRNYLKKISSLQRYASDVDAYFDQMLQLANGNQAEAMRMTKIFMQRLGITQEMLEPYMRER